MDVRAVGALVAGASGVFLYSSWGEEEAAGAPVAVTILDGDLAPPTPAEPAQEVVEIVTSEPVAKQEEETAEVAQESSGEGEPEPAAELQPASAQSSAAGAGEGAP